MKKLVFIACCLMVFVTSSSAQTEVEKAITETLTEYFKANETKDYEKVLEYIHPALFEIVPKDKMLEVFEQIDADPSMKITMTGFKIDKFSDAFDHSTGKYLLVNYNFSLLIKSENQEKEFLSMLLNSFKSNYGAEKVELTDDGIIKINNTAEMFAIQHTSAKDWKFLENKANLKPLLATMIPEDVITYFDSL